MKSWSVTPRPSASFFALENVGSFERPLTSSPIVDLPTPLSAANSVWDMPFSSMSSTSASPNVIRPPPTSITPRDSLQKSVQICNSLLTNPEYCTSIGSGSTEFWTGGDSFWIPSRHVSERIWSAPVPQKSSLPRTWTCLIPRSTQSCMALPSFRSRRDAA